MLNSSPAISKICALRRRELLLDVDRLRGQRLAVDVDAGALDVDQHRDQRQLEVAVERREPLLLEETEQRGRELEREVGPLARVVQRLVDRIALNDTAFAPRPHTSSSLSALYPACSSASSSSGWFERVASSR